MTDRRNEEIYCASCGAVVASSANFCASCGTASANAASNTPPEIAATQASESDERLRAERMRAWERARDNRSANLQYGTVQRLRFTDEQWEARMSRRRWDLFFAWFFLLFAVLLAGNLLIRLQTHPFAIVSGVKLLGAVGGVAASWACFKDAELTQAELHEKMERQSWFPGGGCGCLTVVILIVGVALWISITGLATYVDWKAPGLRQGFECLYGLTDSCTTTSQ